MDATPANACAIVQSYREQGLTEQQIEALARSNKVPEYVIRWAKRRCAKALTPR